MTFEQRRTLARMLREQERLMAARSGKRLSEIIEQERRAIKAAKRKAQNEAWKRNRLAVTIQAPAKGKSNVKTTPRPTRIVPGFDPKGRAKFAKPQEITPVFPVEVRKIASTSKERS